MPATATQVYGGNYVSLGNVTGVSTTYGTAVGYGSKEYANYGTAVGYSNTAGVSGSASSYTRCTAVGASNTASGTYSAALGTSNTASGSNAFAAGRGSTASGTSSVAIGYGASATGEGSIAIGSGAACTADGGVALGTAAVGDSSTPVYLDGGVITACSSVAAATADALSVSAAVGGSTNPVYISSAGAPTACSSTMGYYYGTMSLTYAHDSASATSPGSGTYDTTSTATFYVMRFGSLYVYAGKVAVADDTDDWTRITLSSSYGSTTRCVIAAPQKSSTSGYTPGVIVYYSGNYVYYAIDENLTSTVTYVHLLIVRS